MNNKRRIILSMYISLDGYVAGPGGELDWFIWDKEMEAYSIDLIKTIDTMLFGRVTYQLMESYWPNASPPTENQIIIDAMNNTPKVVVSETLNETTWNNTSLIKEKIPEEVSKLKQKKGKDIVIYGSSVLASALTKHKLIDEYQFFVNPVVIGKGKPLFENINGGVKLKLTRTKVFNCGNVLQVYEI
jgi:dihydrofolate reductase